MEIDIEDLANYSLYAEIKNDFLKLMKEKINIKFGSMRKFILYDKSFSQTFYCNLFNGKRVTKLNFWLKICRLLDISHKDFKSNIIKIRGRFGGFLTPEILPIGPSEDLASLVGHALGDGHISERVFYFSYTNVSNELQDEVRYLISKFCTCKNSQIFYKALTTCYPSIVAVILYLAGAKNGNKIVKEFSVPKWIMNGSKRIKISFLRALFDDEGSVKKSSHEILFKLSKNENHLESLYNFMNQVKKLLEEIDVSKPTIKVGNMQTGRNGKTIQLVLGVYGYKNFVKFQDIISFFHAQKTRELKELIDSYKNIKLRSGEGQSIVYEKLTEPKTIYSLARELNISTIAVYKHLRKLEDKNLVRKQINIRNRPAIWSRIK